MSGTLVTGTLVIGTWSALVGLIALQRLIELAVARVNTRRLMAAGAVEYGAGHYPVLVALHVAWLASLLAFVPGDAPIDPWLLAAFLALQAGRVWVLVTLGRRWTTRIVVPRGEPAIRRGPYRLLRHPNYAIVALEIALVPLIAGAWEIALVFSALNAAMLWWRIRAEDRALAGEGGPHPSTGSG